MVSILLLIAAGCLGLLVLIGIVIVLQSDRRDVVSPARQDWINRRSQADPEER